MKRARLPAFSLTSYMVAAVIVVHLVLTPLLFSSVLNIYKSSSDEQFILHARELSGLLADEFSRRNYQNEQAEIINMLDSTLLGGNVRFIDIVSTKSVRLVPSEEMMITDDQFIEDSGLSENGDEIFFLKVPVRFNSDKDVGFSLRLGFDESAVNEEYLKIKQLLIYLIAFYFIFMVMFITLITRFIHKPLRLLATKSRMIAQGDVDSQLDVGTNISDIKLLGEDLDQMRRSLVEMADNMHKQATHDELTGLPNRYLFRDRLEQAISFANRNKNSFAVLLLDLNRFKEINDTLGHGAGDKVLKEVAMRTHGAIRESDTIARIGGDEFSVILADVDCNQAELITNKLIKMLEPEMYIDGHSLSVGACAGISLFPNDGTNAEVLLQHADVAMYNAKNNNLSFVSYRADMDHDSYEKLILVNDIKNSITTNQFEALFHPKLSSKNNQVVGCELLLRWQHPYLGMISPEKFIPLAEQENLIGELTRWATSEYLREFKEIIFQQPDFHIAINVSPVNLLDSQLLKSLRQIVEMSGIPAENLMIEITENVIMKNPERSASILQEFHESGIKVAIDDFGTGYSSLAYLKQFPISELKIDKSFILDLTRDSNNYPIVKAAITMSHDLGIKVVAEGVETDEVDQLLREIECDYLQGFFYQRPLTVSQFKNWYAAN